MYLRLDLLRERGVMTGSSLGAITGLNSGAITGVVERLERAEYLRLEPDPHDRAYTDSPSGAEKGTHSGRDRPIT